MENNKNKKSVKFQGDMLNFCDFFQVFVFTTNHHLNGRFAKNVSLRRPYQVRILLFLCFQINISAKEKSLIGGEMIYFTMYVSMLSDLYLISTNIRSEVGATVSAMSTLADLFTNGSYF